MVNKAITYIKNVSLFTVSVLVGLLLAEGLLRLVNPVELRLRGNHIVLKPDVVYTMPNFVNDKLPPQLIHTKNNIGFRGPNWPPPDGALRIFAVGGSTTECFYLSDGQDWPAVMTRELQRYISQLPPQTVPHHPEALQADVPSKQSIPSDENGSLSTTILSQHPENPSALSEGLITQPLWINNAGLSGHSTFGHFLLLEDILADLKPDVILYLVGANDVGRLDLSDHNQHGVNTRSATRNLRQLMHTMAYYSDLAALTENLLRQWRAQRLGVLEHNIDFASHPTRHTDDEELERILSVNATWFVPEYRKRLTKLIERTIELGILPVLLTQPLPYGPGIDPETGIDLSIIDTGSGSGYQRWREVELYNDVTRELASEYGIPLIDLERLLPKSTRYYYDFIHYTVEGAEAIGQIIARELLRINTTD